MIAEQFRQTAFANATLRQQQLREAREKAEREALERDRVAYEGTSP